MTKFNFIATEAKREAVPPLIALWGSSGCGKTLSALKLARGIVGAKGKIVVMDTENGRAKFYSDECGGWTHVDVQPPFSPEKYSAGFNFCKSQDADIIIVDSMSHVWEGQGGVVDIANNARSKAGYELQGLAKWNKPKMAHKKMMNSLIRSSKPVIFCLRGKEKMVQVGKGKDMEIISKGQIPICEKMFPFEMTLCLNLIKEGFYDLNTSKQVMKGLKSIFPANTQISEEMGVKMASWLAGGEGIDKEEVELKRLGNDAALKGETAYIEWKNKLNDSQKKKIRKYHSDWASIAVSVIDTAEMEEDVSNNADEQKKPRIKKQTKNRGETK